MKNIIILCLIFLTACTAFSAVIVSWNTNTEKDLAGYKIYFGKKSRLYENTVTVNTDTSHIIDNYRFLEGAKYYFAVTAFDSSGNESGFSEEVSVTIPNSPPNKPTNVKVEFK